MQRQLLIKLLSKIPRNASTKSIPPKPSISSLTKDNSTSTLTKQSISHYSTLSRSNLRRLYDHNGVAGSIRNGFAASSVVTRRFFSNAFLKGKGKGLVNGGAVWTRMRRDFNSFDSQFGGWRSVLRRLTPDGVVIGLIVTNAAVFILWRIADPQFMMRNFMISVDNVTSGRIYTLVTAAFSHRDMWHLISNMIGLYFFGLSMGRTFGPEYLLKLYLSGAVVGSIFYLAYHAFLALSSQRNIFGVDPSKVPGLGASGAVNAIMLLDIFLYPTKTIYLDFTIPVPAILLGIFIIGKDLLRIMEGDHQISGSAHLGGATVAAIAWARSRKGRFRRF